jgi:hypothetical protein
MSKERAIGLIAIVLLLGLFWMNFLNYDGIESESYKKKQNEKIESYQNRFFFDEESLLDERSWIIQVAAFESIEKSLNTARRLEENGYKPYISKRIISNKNIYRVRVSGRDIEKEIKEEVSELIKLGFEPSIIRDSP